MTSLVSGNELINKFVVLLFNKGGVYNFVAELPVHTTILLFLTQAAWYVLSIPGESHTRSILPAANFWGQRQIGSYVGRLFFLLPIAYRWNVSLLLEIDSAGLSFLNTICYLLSEKEGDLR